MTTYMPRSAWTSTSTGGATLSTLPSDGGIAVHWPGTTLAAFGVESQAKVAERLRGWRNFHVNGRGWSDIGYNFAVDQAGRVWMLRSTNWAGNRVGAHSASSSNPNANRHRVGVLLILGANEQPSAAMIEAFRHWRHTRFLAGWPGRTDLRGHGQVPGASTSCPGPRTRTLISNGTLAARPSSGSSGGTTPAPKPPPSPEVPTMTPQDIRDALSSTVSATSHAYKSGAHALGRRIDPRDALRQAWTYGVLLWRHVAELVWNRKNPETGRSYGHHMRLMPRDVRDAIAPLFAEQNAKLAAMADVLAQIGGAVGPVDWARVADAAEAGAREALSTARLSVGWGPDEDVIPADDVPADED